MLRYKLLYSLQGPTHSYVRFCTCANRGLCCMQEKKFSFFLRTRRLEWVPPNFLFNIFRSPISRSPTLEAWTWRFISILSRS